MAQQSAAPAPVGGGGQRIVAALDDDRARRATACVAGALGLWWALQQLWPAPVGVLVQGVVIGGLTALIAFGIALVYRANRIINFAQGELGAVPASLAVLLIVGPGLPYALALPIGIAVALVLGAAIELLLVRRFFKAPRLILTVVTIGIAQLLAGLGFLLPSAFDINTPPQSFPSPFDFTFNIGQTVFTGNDIVAMIAVPLCIVALVGFFRFTNIGVAVRAAAESADRASLLGVPVKRLETVVWIIAAVLSTVAVFLRAGIVGLPFGQLLGPSILVRALAAVVIARMERLPTILGASIALGVIEAAIVFNTGVGALVDPILFGIIVVALLVQRGKKVARGDETAGLDAAREVRPVPRELVRLPEVRWGLALSVAVPALAAISLPLVMSGPDISLAAVIVITAIVVVSLVVLTGWAGQVSLGQVGFMGIGAASGAHMTTAWGWDLGVAIVLAGLVGSVVAIAIGLPALRIKGLLLSVTTLSFALATSSYVLSPNFQDWLPDERFERPLLFGAIGLESEVRYYYFSLVCLVIAVLMVRGLHRSRAGRVLVAIRDNERSAQAFGVNLTTAKLMAFGMSGFIAAFAGAVFVHHQQVLGTSAYTVGRSFEVFTIAVIGGLGSIPGAIIGTIFVVGIEYFRDLFPETIANTLGFLTSGVGLIVILLMLPGGLGSGLFTVRDKLLRQVAVRRGLIVPSLLADSRQEIEAAVPLDREEVEVVTHAAELATVTADPPDPIPVGVGAGASGARRRREPLRARRLT